MTPSTGIFNFVAGKALEHGIVVEQAEDEIAAINMALGASFGGREEHDCEFRWRFCADGRGAFPCRHDGNARSDRRLPRDRGLRPDCPRARNRGSCSLLCYAGHGEFPRVIFAPGTPEQAVHLTNKAFDLAEKYQIPAFVLTDQYLADSGWSYETLDLEKIGMWITGCVARAFRSVADVQETCLDRERDIASWNSRETGRTLLSRTAMSMTRRGTS